jgi:hypothetical protein
VTRFRGPTRIVASLLANKALFGSLLRDNALSSLLPNLLKATG